MNFGYWDRGLKAVVAQGMEQYLWRNGILFKDYAQHVKQVSERLRAASVRAFEKQGLPVIFERSARADKEKLARRVALERNIESGLVCAIGTIEPSPAFEHRGTHIVR